MSNRPGADDYYWYMNDYERDEEWRPIEIKDGLVRHMGLADLTPVVDLLGIFILMNRPLPFIAKLLKEDL